MAEKNKFDEILLRLLATGWLRRRLRDLKPAGETVEDLLQQFLCQFWERLAKRNFREVNCPESYINRSVTNFKADYLNHRKRERARKFSLVYEGDSRELVDHILQHHDIRPVTANQTADEDAAFEQDSKIVLDTIEKMPPKRRLVFLLRNSGLSNKEVAKKLGIRPGTVVNHYSVATQAISAALEAAGSPTTSGGSSDDDHA